MYPCAILKFRVDKKIKIDNFKKDMILILTSLTIVNLSV